MEKVTTKLKSVCFSLETDKDFTKIALKLGRNKNVLFSQFVTYFAKTAKDPADINDEELKNTLSKGINRIISFIKKQEQEAIVPLLANSELSNNFIKSVSAYLKNHSEVSAKHKANLVNNINKLHENQSRISQELGTINQKLIISSSNEMKQKFLKLFESYVLERDNLGFTSGTKTKEELILKYKNQIKQL